MDLPRPLARTLGLPAVLFLTLSISTPASSVFVILPGMVGAAGSGALLALLIAILICLATGVVYAELASAWPVAGGEYVFVAHTLGPAAGFAMLVVNLFNTLLFPVVAAVRLAQRLRPRSAAASDASLPSPSANRLLFRLFAAERRFLRVTALPVGISLLAVCRRMEDSGSAG